MWATTGQRSHALGHLQYRAAQTRLALRVALSDGVPRFVVGDAHRLSQILTNLVSNALKFTDAGEVVVRVDAEPSVEEHSLLRFSISDTGIGIPRDKQAMIFEAFGQADESVSRRFGGRGSASRSAYSS
jgi:signal transduction histidine kinase